MRPFKRLEAVPYTGSGSLSAGGALEGEEHSLGGLLDCWDIATLWSRELNDWSREANRVLSPAWGDPSNAPFCRPPPWPFSSIGGELNRWFPGSFQAPERSRRAFFRCCEEPSVGPLVPALGAVGPWLGSWKGPPTLSPCSWLLWAASDLPLAVAPGPATTGCISKPSR